jgi:hypothetical protein
MISAENRRPVECSVCVQDVLFLESLIRRHCEN